MSNETTNQYEVTFILGEETTEDQAKAKVTTITETVTRFGGSVTKQELWGKRELAYTIKRNRIGFYTTLWIDLPAPQVDNLEKELRFDESILRSLVTKAYTSAQPGSLYPVTEEAAEKPARGGKRTQEEPEAATAEESLRRTSTRSAKKVEKVTEEEAEEQSEEERLQKLDAALGDILKDEA